jgi:NAD(P)-dependent dehydrogenase (short-subunit alcohol dehydrogenase family)
VRPTSGGRDGITVNCIVPAGDSDAYRVYADLNPGIHEAISAAIPMRRMGDCRIDIAGAVLGLVSRNGRFITGAESPLGRAAAQRVEREGARVIRIDSGTPAALAQAVEAAAKPLGGLHALVNVLPAKMAWAPFFVQQGDAELAQALQGVQAVAAAMRAAQPHFVKTGARVVNVGSVFGSTSFDQLSASVTADHALQGLTRALGVEWARDRIQVNHLAPAAIDLPELHRFRESQTRGTARAA